MSWRTFAFGLFVGIAIASVAATPVAASSSLTAVRRSIDAGNAKFLKALEAGDAKMYAALFAPGGIELPSGGGDVTSGRVTIQADEAASTGITVYVRYFEIWEKLPDGAFLIKLDCGYPDKYTR